MRSDPERLANTNDLMTWMHASCQKLAGLGVFNMLLSNGEDMYVFCSTKLCWITRRAPFAEAVLEDVDLTVDFSHVTTEKDVVTVIATRALTNNEQWEKIEPGSLLLFREGELVQQIVSESDNP